jgi:hypothetical protein
METDPRLDASRPTGLRFAGFLLAVGGAVLLGYGSIATWVTVGVREVTNTNTPIPGTDLTDGLVTLGCGVAILLLILAVRLVRGRSVRMGLAAAIIAAGVIGAVVGGAFLGNGVDRQVVLDAIGIPRAEWEANHVFREIGLGPYLAVGGGIMAFFAGILTLAWAQRLAPSGAVSAEPD